MPGAPEGVSDDSSEWTSDDRVPLSETVASSDGESTEGSLAEDAHHGEMAG
jgi:hypothetical protein